MAVKKTETVTGVELADPDREKLEEMKEKGLLTVLKDSLTDQSLSTTAEKTGYTENTVSSKRGELADRGLVEVEGQRRWTTYHLTEEGSETLAAAREQEFQRLQGLLENGPVGVEDISQELEGSEEQVEELVSSLKHQGYIESFKAGSEELLGRNGRADSVLKSRNMDVELRDTKSEYELDSRDLLVFMYSLKGDDVSEIEERLGIDSRDVIGIRDRLERFMEDTGRYTKDYTPSKIGLQLLGHMHAHPEDLGLVELENFYEKNTGEGEQQEVVEENDIVEEVYDTLLDNNSSMPQSQLVDELDVKSEEFPQLIGEVRNRYDVVRKPEGDDYTVVLREEASSTDYEGTGGALWQKIRSGQIPGNEVDPGKLVKQFNTVMEDNTEALADEIVDYTERKGGSIPYDELASELNLADDEVARGIYLAHRDGEVKMGAEELRLADQDDVPGWTDFS